MRLWRQSDYAGVRAVLRGVVGAGLRAGAKARKALWSIRSRLASSRRSVIIWSTMLVVVNVLNILCASLWFPYVVVDFLNFCIDCITGFGVCQGVFAFSLYQFQYSLYKA
jgi:hypothetical protein